MEEFNLDSIDKTFMNFKVNTKVKAKVVAILKEGVLLNIGGKKDGLIKFCDEEKEALKGVKVGQEFDAIITNTKDESGAIILSKAKADFLNKGNELVNGLKVGDNVNLIITNFNKSGLISNIGSFEVFVPYSQISSRRVDNNLKNYINKQFTATVLEINFVDKKIVCSIKAYEEDEKQTKETAFWLAIFENKVVSGKVVRFADFGAFVNVDGVDCLLHNLEASYDRTKKASDVLELNKTYNFRVIKCDKENKRVSLSYKVLQSNPITEKLKTLKVGDVVEGVVQKILPFGAIIKFNENLEGLLHVKEASHFYIKNVYEVAKVGQKLKLKIIAIDLDNNKVSLSLKALQEEPEIVKLANEITTNKKENNKNVWFFKFGILIKHIIKKHQKYGVFYLHLVTNNFFYFFIN